MAGHGGAVLFYFRPTTWLQPNMGTADKQQQSLDSSPFPSYHHPSSTIRVLDLTLDKQAVSFGPWWHSELVADGILRLLRLPSRVVLLISTIL